MVSPPPGQNSMRYYFKYINTEKKPSITQKAVMSRIGSIICEILWKKVKKHLMYTSAPIGLLENTMKKNFVKV